MTHGALDYTHITQAKMIAASVELDLPLILLDRFDSANFLWNGSGTGADWDALREAGAAYEGDAGMALRTKLTAPAAGDWVQADRYAFGTATKKMSFSALFRINQLHTFVDEIRFWVMGVHAGQQYTAAVRYAAWLRRWEYYDEGANWITLLENIDQDTERWQRVHFDFDMENRRYLRFETADENIDMQGIPIRATALAQLRYVEIRIVAAATVNGTRADISIDNVILKELGS
jgi:hypothetical protein